jgi:FMN-dependent NADH-azoreductase
VDTLLAIEVSPRFEGSISRTLTAKFVEQWEAAHPDGTVIRRDLIKTNIPLVDVSWIGGAFARPDQHSEEMEAAMQISDALVAELVKADAIVIATPMYNFSIPAVLKAWIDRPRRASRSQSPTRGCLPARKQCRLPRSSARRIGFAARHSRLRAGTGYLASPAKRPTRPDRYIWPAKGLPFSAAALDVGAACAANVLAVAIPCHAWSRPTVRSRAIAGACSARGS